MGDLQTLFALALAGAAFGPGIFCAIAAIYDGYDRHRCTGRRVLRSSAFVAVAFFATLVGLMAAENGAAPAAGWDWRALLMATTMAFAVSLLPATVSYLSVFQISRRLQHAPETQGARPARIHESGNPYQPPAC